jgi:AcrR family transcriptional regulator
VTETLPEGPPIPETLIPSQRARRERIISTAMTLLKDGAYETIQMRDIAETADVALGTVYRYFASKEHLFAAVLLEWSTSLHYSVQRRPLAGDTPQEQLDDLMRRVLNACGRHPQFIQLIILLESTPDPHAQHLHQLFNSRSIDTFLGPLAKLHPDDADDVIDIIGPVLWSLLRQRLQGTISLPNARRAMSRTIDIIFSPGIRADPSR